MNAESMQKGINCSVGLRSTTAAGDRRYSRMRNQWCRSVSALCWVTRFTSGGGLRAPAVSRDARLKIQDSRQFEIQNGG
jgi:hypothetical protein